MSGLECFRDVTTDLHDLLERKRGARYPGAERFPFDVLHRDEVIAVRFLHLVDRDDIRMVQGCGKLSLADKALACRARGQRVFRKDLQCHRAIEALIAGAIDGSHAAGPEEFLDAVPRDGLTDRTAHMVLGLGIGAGHGGTLGQTRPFAK